MQTTTIGFVNHGGGSGKSTSSEWMLYYLANREISALGIDTDSQGSMTARLLRIPDQMMVEQALGEQTLANVFNQSMTLGQIARPAQFNPRVQVAGTDRFLIGAIAGIASKAGSNLMLRRALRREKELNAKVTVIDTPPAVDILVENALYASDYIVIPATPESKCVRGIQTVKDMVAMAREHRLEDSDGRDTGPVILGVVICRVGLNNDHKRHIEEIKRFAAQIADENGHDDDCYMRDEAGGTVRGILGLIPRYEGINARTNLWEAYGAACSNIYCAADL